jgi:hypothetical protein
MVSVVMGAGKGDFTVIVVRGSEFTQCTPSFERQSLAIRLASREQRMVCEGTVSFLFVLTLSMF